MSYDWKNISPHDSFQVERGHLLSLDEEKALQFLYLPIIGQSAYSLFLFLNHLRKRKDGKPHYLKDVFAILDMGIQDFFYARIRLEALALIESYKREEHYIFRIKKALDSQAFLNDPILDHLLLQQLGQQSYDYVLDQLFYSESDLENYQAISRRFIDVYPLAVQASSSHQPSEQVSLNTPQATQPIEISEEESQFEWDVFISSLRQSFLSSKQIEDPQFKSYVLFLHACYGVDEIEMSQLIQKLSDLNTGEINYDRLTAYIRKNYQVKQDSQLKDLVKPTADQKKAELKESQKQNLSQQDANQALIQASLDNSPIEFLTSIKDQLGGFVSANERRLVEDLMKTSKLPPAVINILLHYILVVKENSYLHANFVNQIANDWAMKKINQPEDALSAARDFSQKKLKAHYQKNKRTHQQASEKKLAQWDKEENYQEQALDSEGVQSFKKRIEDLRHKIDKEGD